MLYHLVAHGFGWTLLYRDHPEARDLWVRLVDVTPGLVAACLMPDHFHLLARHDASRPVRRALGHYAQWRNRRRGEVGPVFEPMEPVQEVKEGLKGWRMERYVNLNPCRAGLADSPLTWPWCSYRDAVGLSLAPVRRVSLDPVRYHGRTINDTTVDGVPLPTSSQVDLSQGRVALPTLWDAVSSLTRTPSQELGQRGPARTLFLHAARSLTPLSCSEIARWAGVGRATVYRAPAELTAEMRMVERVAGDPRFQGLGELDERALWRWLEARRARARRNVRLG